LKQNWVQPSTRTRQTVGGLQCFTLPWLFAVNRHAQRL
jgi:hypothetical protein